MNIELDYTNYEEKYSFSQIYEKAFHNANDIILLLSNDGKILKANKKAIETYGYTEKELLSMNVFDIRNEKRIELAEIQLERAKNDGIEFQTIHYGKDGVSIPVEVKSVGIDVNKEKVVLSIVRNISDRIKHEQEMRELAAIVENSDDAIIGKNLDGIITSWNKGAETLYGYTQKEAIGKDISLVVPKERIDELHNIMNKIRDEGKVERIETIRKKKNGEIIDVSITVSPIYDFSGNLIGDSNITRDITQNKKSEQELRDNYEEISSLYEELTATDEELRINYQELEKAKEEAENANEAKSQFLANMSHEIRTPMNGIIGMLELLKSTDLNEIQDEYLEMLTQSSNLLLEILNTILDISKIEAEKFELNMNPFNLKKTLDRITKELSIACNKKNLEIFYYIDPFINFDLVGDEVRLNQVLINIINNAVKFTDKGQILFKVENVNNIEDKIILKFSVQDTGIGISEEFKKNIFKKFFQQDMSKTKRYYGTGLGLAISREIVKMMNGDIWFESVENVGSTFYFTAEFLLNTNKNIDNFKTLSLDKSEITIDTNKKILIVEDNEINMRIICEMLERLGYEFKYAYTGAQALDVLHEYRPDLILMDIQMPQLNGYETTKIIRKKEINTKNHTPIIAMTAYAMQGDKESCIDVGMDDYISKPFNMDTLKNTILKFI